MNEKELEIGRETQAIISGEGRDDIKKTLEDKYPEHKDGIKNELYRFFHKDNHGPLNDISTSIGSNPQGHINLLKFNLTSRPEKKDAETIDGEKINPNEEYLLIRLGIGLSDIPSGNCIFKGKDAKRFASFAYSEMERMLAVHEMEVKVNDAINNLPESAMSIDSAEKIDLSDNSKLNLWTMTPKEAKKFVGETFDGKKVEEVEKVYCANIDYGQSRTTIVYFADKKALKKNIVIELDKISKEK